jgi:hypothetical protein
MAVAGSTRETVTHGFGPLVSLSSSLIPISISPELASAQGWLLSSGQVTPLTWLFGADPEVGVSSGCDHATRRPSHLVHNCTVVHATCIPYPELLGSNLKLLTSKPPTD